MVDEGELHAGCVNGVGGSGVGSGERWGRLTRLFGSMWGGGGPREPNCIDKKYLVAACRSCSLSSAVCLLNKNLKYRLKFQIAGV